MLDGVRTRQQFAPGARHFRPQLLPVRTHGHAEFKYMEMLIAAALIYWGMSAVFELVQSRIERKFGKGVTS